MQIHTQKFQILNYSQNKFENLKSIDINESNLFHIWYTIGSTKIIYNNNIINIGIRRIILLLDISGF